MSSEGSFICADCGTPTSKRQLRYGHDARSICEFCKRMEIQVLSARENLHEINAEMAEKEDIVNPSHYKQHPAGIECIDVVEHMPFNLGNAIKYIWRAGLKTEDPGDDLRKAIWYVKREIERRAHS